MENSRLELVLDEIIDALENEVEVVPHDAIIQYINEEATDLTNTDLDTLVGLLEDKGYGDFASSLADEIANPTLETEIENNQPWFKNDKRNRAAIDEPKQERERSWVQRYMHICSKHSNVVYTPQRLDSPIWRNDL